MERIISFFGGFFLSMFIIAVTLKVFANLWGALSGIAIAGILAAWSYRKYQKQPKLKLVAIGMISSLGFFLTLIVLGWSILLSALK